MESLRYSMNSSPLSSLAVRLSTFFKSLNLQVGPGVLKFLPLAVRSRYETTR